jgi:DNA-binding NtrC family response regulator
MRTAPTLLIADDDADVAVAARLALRRAFAEVVTVATPQQVAAAVERHRPAVLLLDMNFTPGRHDGEEGLALLAQLTARADAPAVVVMTAYADIALAVRALKAGAFDFVPKPWDNAKLVATVSAALAAHAPAATDPTSPLIGDSTAMRELRALIANVAPTDANVLILGENGVGKELVARALHQASARAAATFLAVDLGAVPENTFESELFGHRKGSFTDARSDRAGRFRPRAA